MSTTYSIAGVFPNGLAPKSVKDTHKYGEQVASAILASTQEYREYVRAKAFECRKFVDARQSIKEYLDELDIDGQKMYANISYKPRPIIQKFLKVVVDGYILRREYPNVTATSKHIKDRKDKRIADAEFRMNYGNDIGQLSQESGLQLEDPKDFTPKSVEELEIYKTLSDKEREELLMQEMVSFALKDNNIKEKKRTFLTETFVTSLCGYYNHIDENGRLDITAIQAEDAIMSDSHKSVMTDVHYAGHFLRMKVSELRSIFAISGAKEKELFSAAKNCLGKYGNPLMTMRWQEDYRMSDARPYDNVTVELYHVWWKTSQIIGLADGVDASGKKIRKASYDYDSDAWRQENESLLLTRKFPQTAYEGYFLAANNMCLEWGEQKNVLKKGKDKQTLLCPYIYAMPYNNGNMKTPSSVHIILDSVRNMDVAILKIKQIIVNMAPDDMMIDLDSLLNIDLGDGELNPLDIITIYKQTGNLFWRSRQEDGDKEFAPPVRAGQAGVGSNLQHLITWYNTELQNIKEYLGINDFRDGSASQARTGFRFQQAQLEASNTATFFLYDSYVSATEELIKQVAIRIWDALLYGDANEGYLQYIGKENVDWLKSRKEITDSSYDIEFSMGMTDADKANLEAKIQGAIEKGQLELPDALMLEDIEDPKKAYKLLTYVYNVRRRERMEEAQANQKSAADYSAQAGVAVEEAKQQTAKIMADLEMAKERERGKNAQLQLYQKTALDLLVEAFKSGKEIPETLTPLIASALEPLQIKNEMDANAAEQEMQQMEQAQNQQAMLQELQSAVESGEITAEEAQEMASENGLV